jgi:hypothetical protein
MSHFTRRLAESKWIWFEKIALTSLSMDDTVETKQQIQRLISS